MHPGWLPALLPVADTLRAIGDELGRRTEIGEQILPAPEHLLRVLSVDPASVRVLIVGQDPYPTPGHPIGLAFAADAAVWPLPRSVANIFQELHDDLGLPLPDTADLSPWQDRGVMLLNRVLSVTAGDAGSHRGLGWESVTDAIAGYLAARDAPLVAVLWGRDAQKLAPVLDGCRIVTGVHPSPLSARRGFFGSRPFSAINRALREQGAQPVDWSLPSTVHPELF